MKLALVRHPAPLVPAGICYGRLDLPLSADGEAAIGGIAGELAAFPAAMVWSSPARRCTGLASAIAGRNNLPLRPDARLQELDFGAWEGRRWDDVPRGPLDRWAADPLSFAPPGGESGAALIARVRSFHRTLMADRRDCVVISHGGPLKVLASLLAGRPVDLLAAPPAFGQVEIIGC